MGSHDGKRRLLASVPWTSYLILSPWDDVFYLAGIVLCALLIRHERHLRSARTADPWEGQLVFPEL